MLLGGQHSRGVAHPTSPAKPAILPYHLSNQNYSNFINGIAFTPQAVGAAGNEARARLYGPDQRSIDFSLFKGLPAQRAYEAGVPVEFRNTTNTENFGEPNVTLEKRSSALADLNTGDPGAIPVLGAGGFGQITASNQP